VCCQHTHFLISPHVGQNCCVALSNLAPHLTQKFAICAAVFADNLRSVDDVDDVDGNNSPFEALGLSSCAVEADDDSGGGFLLNLPTPLAAPASFSFC
jgi:hypothetical protein